MVMHARKTQRLSDGYFEKQQAHPYQNSKYGSKSASGERYSRGGGGSDSPNGNAYRSDSGDSESPRDGRDRDRSYTNKGSYLQKIREKERENRDYKSSRDKYSDCVRSPKEKRSRDSEHRTNHDRSSDHDKSVLHPIKLTSTQNSRDRKLSHNCQEKREEREQRVSRVGDWSEHVSSSGKKYYYNCKTEVSQWEKPREWIERERERERSARERQKEHRDRDRDSDTRSSYGSSSRTGRSPIGDASASGTRTKAFLRSAAHEKHSNARAGGGGGSGLKGATVSSVRQWPGSGNGRGDAVESDRTPSATDATTSVEPVRRRPDASDAQDMDISPGDGTPTSEGSRDAPADPVPRPTGTPPAVPPPGHAPGPPGIATAASIPSGPSIPIPGAPRPAAQTPNHKDAGAQPVAGSSVGQPLKIETGHVCVADGPPTPTHSEGQDCGDTRKLNSPPSSLSSLGALRPQGPSLTPSLANHYRDDLVNHVRGWPAEILEKQAQKLIEEAHILGSLQCTKVSADLKIARSLVRLTEIQATLQEQRILFLRQQIKMLEELKSQNSFMSDDS